MKTNEHLLIKNLSNIFGVKPNQSDLSLAEYIYFAEQHSSILFPCPLSKAFVVMDKVPVVNNMALPKAKNNLLLDIVSERPIGSTFLITDAVIPAKNGLFLVKTLSRLTEVMTWLDLMTDKSRSLMLSQADDVTLIASPLTSFC